jgi:Ca2+-binding RTX toxin-like protein
MRPIRTLATCTAALAVGLTASAASATAAAPPAPTDPGITWISGDGGVRTTVPTDRVVTPRGTASPSTCRGVPATTIVDAGYHYLGTDADEVIVVLGSNAVVETRGGDDTICVHGNHAEPGEYSSVDAGSGDDVVLGVSGSLIAYGQEGDDVLLGNGRYLYLYGGDGSDDLNAAGGTWSTMDGGGWNDRITGSPGIDVIQGGEGDDGIWGWDGADEIDGGIGNDAIHGGGSYDILTGGGGSDHCYDVESPVHGADITACTAHLTPDAADDILFG